MNIDWNSSESYVPVNPAYDESQTKEFRNILHATTDFPGHVWLSTSGSSSRKWVGLSKEALLASGASVNRHLESGKEDIWIHALPDFHVGGLAVHARAYLSGATVRDFKSSSSYKWNPEAFCAYVFREKGTLASLVPAQLYDLIAGNFESPPSLRALLIGGGALSGELYGKAIALKWPVLPGYGSTECGSQIATARLDKLHLGDSSLHILDHLHVEAEEGILHLSGGSLLSAYAFIREDGVDFIDPKQNGRFSTEDRGEVNGKLLVVHGRKDELIKIGGETVDFTRLEQMFRSLIAGHFESFALVAVPDVRLGHVIRLAVSIGEEHFLSSIKEFNLKVLPFERIRRVHVLSALPRSATGKILKKELIALLSTGLSREIID